MPGIKPIYKLILFLLMILAAGAVFADVKTGITGKVEWDTLRVDAVVSLDLASAGIKLPAGRLQGEAIIKAEYLKLIRPGIMGLQVDSSSTIGDLVARGELTLQDADKLALDAFSIPPALSQDLKNMTAFYTLTLSSVSAALLRHERPFPVMRTLIPVSAAAYTGIVIIAPEKLPVHGMKSSALPAPCLFPKIWDTDMNLIYERNMLEKKDCVMVRYSPVSGIFQSNPSGLSSELREIVGERPLRIFARGVFGINPTDLIIDREDALLVISSEENRRLLAQGKVVFILDESVLRRDF